MFATAASSLRGVERAVNQDCLRMETLAGGGLVALIADGLGSYTTSAEASLLATESVVAHLNDAAHRGALDQRALHAAVQYGNQVIWREALERSITLKTTLTALLCLPQSPETALLAHVGDCRAYLVRDGLAQTLTRDHTLATELGFIQRLLPARWRKRPSRHVLNRVLGEHPIVRVDVAAIELRPGDRLILCSDGVWGSLDGPDFQSLATAHAEERTVVARLIAEAQRLGSTDDASAILISVESASGAQVKQTLALNDTAGNPAQPTWRGWPFTALTLLRERWTEGESASRRILQRLSRLGVRVRSLRMTEEWRDATSGK